MTLVPHVQRPKLEESTVFKEMSPWDFFTYYRVPFIHPGGLAATSRLIQLVANHASVVLELGCGLGRTAQLLSNQKGCLVIGINRSPGAIHQAHKMSKARRWLKLMFLIADVTCLPLRGGIFDAILIESMLSLVENKEDALREASRCARAGARIAAVEFMWKNEPPKEIIQLLTSKVAKAQIQILTREQYKQLFANSELSLRAVEVQPAPASPFDIWFLFFGGPLVAEVFVEVGMALVRILLDVNARGRFVELLDGWKKLNGYWTYSICVAEKGNCMRPLSSTFRKNQGYSNLNSNQVRSSRTSARFLLQDAQTVNVPSPFM